MLAAVWKVCFSYCIGRFEVELLLGVLDGGPADAAAVDLLQIQALGVVVVEGGLGEGEEVG